MTATVPAGYQRFRVGPAEVVALDGLSATIQDVLSESTLFGYAAHHPRARAMAGRGVSYAVTLPDARTNVVVRHSRHGGVLAPITGDVFLTPTRAPRELTTSLRLAEHRVPTPEVIAYALYPAGPLLRRSDVVTREIPRSRDLAVALLGPVDALAKQAMLEATSVLLRAMTAAGAHHPDLNLKNVLLAPAGDGYLAHLLDVDRVTWSQPGAAATTAANLARLTRSARKWRDLYGANIDESDLAWLGAAVTAGVGS